MISSRASAYPSRLRAMIEDGDMSGSSQRARREATPVAGCRRRYVRRLLLKAFEHEQTETTER